MIKDLIQIANRLDAKGLRKEADYLDGIIKKIAFWYPDSPYNVFLGGGSMYGKSSGVLRRYDNDDDGRIIEEIHFGHGPSDEVIPEIEAKLVEWNNRFKDKVDAKWFVQWEGDPTPNLDLIRN